MPTTRRRSSATSRRAARHRATSRRSCREPSCRCALYVHVLLAADAAATGLPHKGSQQAIRPSTQRQPGGGSAAGTQRQREYHVPRQAGSELKPGGGAHVCT